ncbi:DUF2892 domain-containing protein [Verrucomicrobium sp. 3C]|uniref:YgaP family membrane protein n=1 Tax=Verrucomicrobium sp. 3C TaxID=1134055 RepID=UPI000377D01C|nr:DUF2892 domain-containing protein [Verrucomicrobium sp. 3C]
MTIERKVRVVAGTIILISLLLSLWSRWWMLLTAFVGLNLLQSAFSGFCPAENLFRKLEERHGPTQGTTNS